MKALFPTVFLFFLSIQMLYGQPEKYGTPEQRAEIQTKQMEKVLRLRSDQVPRVHALNLKYARRMQEEVIRRDLSQWSAFNAGRKIHGQKEEELKYLLSADQMKAYSKMKWAIVQKILSNPNAGLYDFIQ